ncbi:MAG: Mrp/NBP35 family ATP-binding protein [Henriciella sp.]
MFRDKKPNKIVSDAVIKDALGDPSWLLGIRIRDGGAVTAVVAADPENEELNEALKAETRERLLNIDGVRTANIVMTAERDPATSSDEPPVAAGQTRVRKGARLSDDALSQAMVRKDPSNRQIPGISRILAVASAKGGVGKSTVAVNMAASFAKQGLRVGLLDADIYGPSIPTMLGATDASPQADASGRLTPVIAHGIHTLSIGYLTDADAPMIWRGPMVQSAITQMLNDAAWGTPEDPLDLLIIDTPPGTGDAQLTLAQSIPVTAAVLVTTPQEVALADVRRGAAMFAKTHVPVLGVVETMSWFEDPAGNRHYVMGEGGGRSVANWLGLPVISQIPIIQTIREGGDAGRPACLDDGAASDIFYKIARDVALGLDALETKPDPKITFVS